MSPRPRAAGSLAITALLASALGLAGADLLGRLWFDKGDIHIDPPAMGIVASTAVVLGLIPTSGVLRLGASTQTSIACLGVALCFVLPPILLGKPAERT